MKKLLSQLFKNIVDLSHDKIQEKLLEKKTLEIMNLYCEKYRIKTPPRIILSSLLFNSDGAMANLEESDPLSRKISDKSRELVYAIIGEKKIDKISKEYHVSFVEWKKKDLEHQKKVQMKITKQVRTIMNKAFWDKILEDLKNKNIDPVMVIVEDLKEKVKGLCMIPAMKKKIDGQFDTKIIRQILENDEMETRDFEMFFRPLSETVLRLQAPDRDADFLKAQEKVVEQIRKDWRIGFVSSVKVLSEAVADIYISLTNLAK